jgi:hypothetical protein
MAKKNDFEIRDISLDLLWQIPGLLPAASLESFSHLFRLD